MKQLYVVLMTVMLSYCDCSAVPLSCPGEDVSMQSFTWCCTLQCLTIRLENYRAECVTDLYTFELLL
jgi:hypothetical protein